MAVAMRRAHGQGYWWYFGLSASDLGRRIAAHDALPVDICAYEEGGQLWFAAVMVPARGKRHAWYFGQHPHDVTRLLRETGG
ncbi:hypothetical protein, partial [Bacillus sp. SIMBA_005]|uniref:hypothetical protein n=1 Tax=Bacillus sp. SIMBA_005 TaxID=3085754 RepID=UPI0039794911